MKTSIYILIITTLLSSCSSNKFLNRKYTQGRFVEHTKTLKYNTIKRDGTKNYASLNNKINLQKSISFSEAQTEKEIITTKVNSIIKKDSIITLQRKGKNKIIIIKNNLPDVYITLDKNNRVVTKKPVIIDHEKIKAKKLKKVRNCSEVALYCSIIPILGFVFAIHTKKIIKKYRKEYQSTDFDSHMAIANLALWISIIPSLLGALIVIAFVLFIILFAFSGALGIAML